MRKVLPIILLLSVNYCHGQFSVSVGASQLRENLLRNENLPVFGKNQLYLYDCYTLQVDYTKSFFRTYTEFGVLPESFEYIEETFYSSGGGSSPYYSDKREYHSNVNFRYLTIKGGVGTEFKKNYKQNWWSSFSFNMFVQYEKLLYKSESDKVMYRTTKSENLMTQTITTTVHPPNYYLSDLIGLESNMFLFGIELKERLGIHNYFAELFISISSSTNYRTYKAYLYSEANNSQSSNWSLNTGIKIGYYFRGKSKTDKKDPSGS